MFNFKLFEAGSLGSGGISEAASLGEQPWSLSAGFLGESALPGFWGLDRLTERRSALPANGNNPALAGRATAVVGRRRALGGDESLVAGRAAYLQPLINRFNTISLL